MANQSIADISPETAVKSAANLASSSLPSKHELVAEARVNARPGANTSKDWKELAASLATIDPAPVERFLAKNLPQIRRLDDRDPQGNPVVSDDEVVRIKKEFIKALGLDKKGVDPKTVALAYGTDAEGVLSVSLIAKDSDGKGGFVANPDKLLFTARQKL